MLETATAREEQRKLDAQRSQQKSLAEQHLDDIASGKKDQANAEASSSSTFKKGRVGEGDDVAFDKQRLQAAIVAEKKRKALDEEEAWAASKRAKTDAVTEEDMGKQHYFAILRRGFLTPFVVQRRTD